MTPPDIAVTICAYNLRRFVLPCLEAYRVQTLAPREILVVDDGSTDGTREILRDYVLRHSNVRLIELPQNVGVQRAFGIAVSNATSRYVYAGALDDIPRPCLIENLSEAVMKYPQASVVTVNYRQWADTGHELPCVPPEPIYYVSGVGLCDQLQYLDPDQLCSQVGKCAAPALGIPLYRRQDLIDSNILEYPLGHYLDLVINLVLGFEDGLVHVPQVLVDFRLASQSYGSLGRSSFTKELTALKQAFALINTPRFEHARARILQSQVFGFMGWRAVIAALSCRSTWNLVPSLLNRKLFLVGTVNDSKMLIASLPRLLSTRNRKPFWRRANEQKSEEVEILR